MLLARAWNTWRRTIRFRLAVLVLACVLPVWLAAGSILYFAYQDKRQTIERRTLETARALSLAVDRELASVQAALGALATSPSLASGDFAAFHGQARELLKAYPDADIILADATGQQMVNSYQPLGGPLPRRAGSEAVRRVFEQGAATITGVYKGAVTGRFLVGVDVPVLRDGKVVYDLAMTLPAERIAAILSQQRLPAEWVGTILDADRAVVGRSRATEQFVGTKVASRLLTQGADVREGTGVANNFEHIPVFASFSMSDVSGWTVVIAVPRAALLAELRQWLAWAAAGALLLSAAGLTLAVSIGRGISRSIGSLVPQAAALAHGRPAVAGSLDFEETEAVGKALETASLLLKERTENLERSNRELEEFAAFASHDLQEPLRKIKSFGERLRENHAQALDATGQDFLRRMESAADRMRALIEDLLEFSRVTTRPHPFARADLGKIARQAKADLGARLRETGGSIALETLPEAEVDASQMRSVFQNLFSNALKFHGEAPPRSG